MSIGFAFCYEKIRWRWIMNASGDKTTEGLAIVDDTSETIKEKIVYP